MPDHVRLSYSEAKEMCGACPSFKVDFQSSGDVSYECTSGCVVPGRQHYSVSPQRFIELVQAFRQAEFFDVPRTDARVIEDVPVYRLAYLDTRKSHEVIDVFRENATLTKLETLFRTAVESDRFAKPSLALYTGLVSSGWKVNVVGEDHQNALTSAAAHDDIESAKYLLENGSAVTQKATMWAAFNNNVAMFRLLLPPSAITSDTDRTMHAEIDAARSSNPALLRYLLDSGVSPNQREPVNGLTPLLNAIQNDRIENTVLLLERGANPNVTDEYGRAPLWYAAAATNTGFIQVLRQHGADVNAKDKYGETALMNATNHCYSWDVEALLQAGADPTLRNKQAETALDLNFLPEPKCLASQKLIGAAQASWPR